MNLSICVEVDTEIDLDEYIEQIDAEYYVKHHDAVEILDAMDNDDIIKWLEYGNINISAEKVFEAIRNDISDATIIAEYKEIDS